MNAPVTMTRADLDAAIADAVAHALKAAGVGAGRAKSSPPKIGYSIRETASVSGLGRTSIYQAIRRGELRALKKGARTIVLHNDLRRWLECLPPSKGGE